VVGVSAPFADPLGGRPLEGFGADTEGGAGGTVYVVDSLADDGPGTLRDALSESNRDIRFAVSGTIVLESPIRLTNHHVTIDGSTAPDPGITISPPVPGAFDLIRLVSTAPDTAHDFVLHHLRFDGGHDNLQIGRGAHDIVIDHCSFRRAGDGNIDIIEDARDITVQWCLLADNHKNMYVYRHYQGECPECVCERISIHHNLLVLGDERNPQIHDCGVVDLVNNVVADWDPPVDDWGGDPGYGTRFRHYAMGNLVKNVYAPGERSDESLAIVLTSSTEVYLEGNIIPTETQIDATAETRWPAPPVTEMAAAAALAAVLAECGAMPRDAIDEEYVGLVDTSVPIERTGWGALKDRFRR